ncbi:MAG: glycosyltransferase family 4 protein, partial [Microthrixaceae bacterium]
VSATSVLQLLDALGRTGEVDLVGVLAAGDLRRPSSFRRRGSLPSAGAASTGGASTGGASTGGASTGGAPAGLVTSTVPVPLPLLYDLWARTGRPQLEHSTGPVDLVHVTVPMRVGVGATPVVATVHDLFPLTRPEDSSARGARLMAGGLEWIRDTARAVMVPSATVAETCTEHGFDPARLRVVPWGATPDEPSSARVAEALARHGLEHPFVLFVGTIEPRKNLSGLVEAMRQLDRPDVTLALVGPDGWGAAPDLAGLATPVARLGSVPSADLSALYAGADVVALASLEEGFGLPVLEAMASGAAVVTSAGTATEEVAGDAALLVDPRSPEDLRDAIAAVLDEPDVGARLRRAGVARAAQFDWERAAAATLDVYREVLG